MVDSLHVVLFAALLALAGGMLFWPGGGHFWRWQQSRQTNERVLIENALKHLYHCEYHKRLVTVESLAGALGIASHRAASLLTRIGALGLLKLAAGELRLTAAGRDYALHIIRVHRLWEHYLAEETGLDETDWHGRAEHREHELSPDEADRLSAQMGDPAYDPHGDPIPTASGDMGPRRGRPCTTLPVGELATIVHIEDEPEELYARLVAEGLHLGMRLELTAISPEQVRFLADGTEHVLTLVAAANISVAPLPREQEMEGPYETLSGLKLREKGRVVRLSPACRGLERHRLMDLGIVSGTVIEAEMKSPGGDPTAYRVRGALIALRREQADQIHIARQREAN